MSFAVVTFLDGTNSVSEVPVCWLRGKTKCWWPKYKNISSLIGAQAKPDEANPNWTIYDVVINHYCATFEEAREKARHIDSTSSSEGETSAKPRKKNAKAHDDYITDYSDVEALSPMPTLIESRNLNLTELLALEEDAGIAPVTSNVQQIQENIFQCCSYKIDVMMDMLTSLKLQVDILLTRDSKTGGCKASFSEIEGIISLMPIKNTETLTTVENMLTPETCPAITRYFQNIGGRDAKEHIIRMLRQTYTNEFGIHCSFYGMRGNINISRLSLTNVMKDAVQEKFSIDDTQWIRQSKQRYIREMNK
uniref:Protein photinus pyralis n=1 Tax=Xenopsylla cheopis TaxID=163159 RepID=A0A6M2DSJ9_XENCH